MNPVRILRSALTYGFLSMMAFLSVFPFLWMAVGATNLTADIVKGKAGIGGALLANATTFFNQVDAPRVFWNSTKIAILSTIFTLTISSLAGYGFEMFRSRVRERI
jgi:lactose/L-arabinose transport system permease protein